MENNTRLIDKEDWRKAPGIIQDEREANSGLAPRDYKIKCNARYLITIIQGYQFGGVLPIINLTIIVSPRKRGYHND